MSEPLRWGKSRCGVVIFLPAVFLDFAEQWKGVRSAYPCVLLTFFWCVLPLHQRCTHSITEVSGGRSLDNDVFKPLQRSDGLCPEHHLQSIVLVNQAQLSRHGGSSSKHTLREIAPLKLGEEWFSVLLLKSGPLRKLIVMLEIRPPFITDGVTLLSSRNVYSASNKNHCKHIYITYYRRLFFLSVLWLI